MNLGIKDKRAVVAGASKGIGLATALGLAAEGARVLICSRSAESLAKAKETIAARTGQTALAVPADLGLPGQSARVVEEAIKLMGGVDILVTNAGGPPPGPFQNFTDEDWISAFRLNCLSALGLIKAAAPGMKAQKWGRIINLTSLAVKQPVPNLILSNGVRAGLVGASKTISQDLAPFNITVNNIAIGYTRTDRLIQYLETKAAQDGRTPAEIEKSLAASVPLGRMCEPGEVAALAVFLASTQAQAITGATIPVDGGACLGLL